MTSFDMDALFDRVIDAVRKEGYAVVQIDDPDGDAPEFTYSIGFPISVDHPEAIVFGLAPKLREFIIRSLHAQMSQKGLRLTDGARVGYLLEGFDCIAREVLDRDMIDEYFCTAIGYHSSQYGREVDRAFQIVWPDAGTGLFPWDDGCSQALIDSQPALYRTSLNS